MDEHKHTQHAHTDHTLEAPKTSDPHAGHDHSGHHMPHPNRNRLLPMVTNNMKSTWHTVRLGMPTTTSRWWPITGNVFGSSCC